MGRLAHGVVIAVIVAAVTAAIGGCGNGGQTSSGSPAASPSPGGDFIVSVGHEPASLDPAISWDIIDWQIQQTIFGNLYRYSMKPGEEGTQLEPYMAEGMPEITNGGKTYTFHLRKGFAFAPPVDREATAEDFKYSFERMLSDPSAPATYFYTGIEGADDFMAGKADEVTGYRILDPQTIQVELLRPDASFLYIMSMQFTNVVAKEWVEKWGKQVGRHPLGCGPFMLDHWTAGQEIVLARNPSFGGSDPVWLDQITYQLSANQTTAFMRLQRGQSDVLGDGLPAADIARAKADPKLKDLVYSQPLIGLSCIALDVRVPPLDEPKVRQAIAWAIDRERIIKVLGGGKDPLYQTIPAGCPGHDEGAQFYGHDPEKARQLLAEAGHADGFKTTLYCSNVDPAPKVMQVVQSDLKDVGIDADVRTMAGATYYGAATTPEKLPVHMWGWWMDFPDPSDFIMPLYSAAYIGDGGSNTSGWSSPEVESLLEEAQTMYDDPEGRLQKFGEMQTIIMEAAPTVILYQDVQTTMCSEATGGFYLHPVYQLQPQAYWKK